MKFLIRVNNQNTILRALPALEELHGLEEDRPGVQVFAGGFGLENRAVLFRAPAAAGDRGDPERVRQRGAAPPVRRGTRGDYHPRGISGTPAHEAAGSRPGWLHCVFPVNSLSRLGCSNVAAWLCWARLRCHLSVFGSGEREFTLSPGEFQRTQANHVKTTIGLYRYHSQP